MWKVNNVNLQRVDRHHPEYDALVGCQKTASFHHCFKTKVVFMLFDQKKSKCSYFGVRRGWVISVVCYLIGSGQICYFKRLMSIFDIKNQLNAIIKKTFWMYITFFIRVAGRKSWNNVTAQQSSLCQRKNVLSWWTDQCFIKTKPYVLL